MQVCVYVLGMYVFVWYFPGLKDKLLRRYFVILQVDGSRSGLWIQEIPRGVMMIPSLARECWRRWGGLKERYFGDKQKKSEPCKQITSQGNASLLGD